jgi:hypothetical protein
MKAAGADSIFVAHEHCNSASVLYDGVRLQYGQKSSTYDRANYIDESTGLITGSYSPAGTPMVGGTVLPISETNGEIVNPYIYLCQNIQKEFTSGVTAYNAESIVPNGNLLSVDGVDGYAKGSRVAIRAKNNKGAALKMYSGDGLSAVEASEIYTDDGKTATTIACDTWYTYIFYIDEAMEVGAKSGRIFADSQAVDLTAEYSDAYIIKDNWSCSNFRFKAFEENGIKGIRYYNPWQISRTDTGTGDSIKNADGTLTYKPKAYTWDARTFTLDNTSSIEQGVYLVFKLKFIGVNPRAMVYQQTDYWNCRPWYTVENKTYLGWDNYKLGEAYRDTWLFATCYMRESVPEIQKYKGSFTFAEAAKAELEAGGDPSVIIAGVYVMTEEAYKQFFGITNEQLH